MKPSYAGIFLILLSTIGFSFMPIFAIYAYKGNISVSTLLLIRFSVASIFFFLYSYVTKTKIHLNHRTLISLFVLGAVFCTIESTMYFSSFKYISAPLAVLIFYLYPILVFFFSILIKKEIFNWKVGLSILLCFGGLIPLIGASFGKMNLLGVLYAAGAALVYSWYILLSNHVVKQLPPVVTSGFITLFTAIGLWTTGCITGTLHFDFKPGTWVPIAGLILFSTLLSMFTFFKALELLDAVKVSVLSMTEPIFTIVFSMILFGDQLTGIQALGGSAVLAGAFLVVLFKSK